MHGAVKLAPSDLVRHAAAVVVAEPTRLRVVASEKGVLWYRAATSGRSAHGSLPHLVDNAVYRMMRFLAQIEPFGHPRDALHELTVSLGTIQGGTKTNLVAGTCSANLDCRHPPGTTKADLEALLPGAAEGSGDRVSLERFHEAPPAAVSAEVDSTEAGAHLAVVEGFQEVAGWISQWSSSQ